MEKQCPTSTTKGSYEVKDSDGGFETNMNDGALPRQRLVSHTIISSLKKAIRLMLIQSMF